jgi:hypothetical protein
MKKMPEHAEPLLNAIDEKKILTMDELKNILGTQSRMTVFRKLKEFNYITSYSHSGKFYSLKRTAKFNSLGLWFINSVLFSKHGTLIGSVRYFVDQSNGGHSASELEKYLKVKVDDVLFFLVNNQKIEREKIFGVYVYFSKNNRIRKQQELFRKDFIYDANLIKLNPEVSMDELKAALIIFFSLLDEQQRRLYAGLESLKIGYGGDNFIARILGLSVKTVAKGRQELLINKIDTDSIRKKGGGRKTIKKKSLKL